MPERTRTDDGCRHMPKLKCPYGNHRFADVPDVAFRNELELRKLKENEISATAIRLSSARFAVTELFSV